MTVALILFAVAAVATAGTLVLVLRGPATGRSAVPSWLPWVNLAAIVVTFVLIVLEVVA